MTKARNFLFSVLVVLPAMVLSFCARVGTPTGGPKDTEPPKLVRAEPPNFTTNFDASSIYIVFDEFIKLDNINQKLVISPPLSKRPDIRLRGKGIYIVLNEPLRENTTYTFNFGDAIADNNEGNVLNNFLYVFSTGRELDSLETGGKVVDAFDLKVPEDVVACLYDDLSDSAVMLKKPLYVSKASKKGLFALRNLKLDTFRIFALSDANGNLKYDPGVDMIGFLDSLLVLDPEINAPLHTTKKDSTHKPGDVRFAGPSLYLRLFLEKFNDQYLKTAEKISPYYFHLIFNQPVKDPVTVKLLDDTTKTGWFFRENFVNGDTLGYWIKDTALIRQERTNILIHYMATDSVGNPVAVIDTATITKPRQSDRKTAKKTTAKASPSGPERLVINFGVSSRMPLELNRNLMLLCGTPVDVWDTTRIELVQIADSVKRPLPFTIKHDTFHLRNYYLVAAWEPSSSYSLTLLPGACRDIYAAENDTLHVSFQSRSPEDYGNLSVSLTGVSGKTLVQLLNDKDVPVREQEINADGTVSFTFLHPAKYRLKAILDINENGKWDTGIYLKHLQPEPVTFYAKQLNIRANWDLEENWTLKFKK